MPTITASSQKPTQYKLRLVASLATAAAIPWVMLALGAPSALLSWLPSAIVALAFIAGFLAIALVSLRGHIKTHFALVGLVAVSIVTLLYAPALAMGGPVVDAPGSVICAPGTALCWNYLHSAFMVEAIVFVLSVLLAIKARAAAVASGA